ncbi:MAG: ATP-binding cassette domain-containing protein, partial [Geminicoccaceae bacterium]|nr:ATP-binding cassette domain-containing protein [Geminicoccaceae bacterium]
ITYRQTDGQVVNIVGLDKPGLRKFHADVRLVFQDPFASLNPRWTVKQIVGDPIRVKGLATGSPLEAKVASLLSLVGLDPEMMSRYPHAFSGGQRQRIGIARALALDPRIIIADEATSALDVSIQAQVINILVDLQQEFGLTYLFISHDLSVVRHLADDVMVMYLGRPVEYGRAEEIFSHPRHPYTAALLSATPMADPGRDKKRIRLDGELPSPLDPPPGCAFNPRCWLAQADCRQTSPSLELGQGRHACLHPLDDNTAT